MAEPTHDVFRMKMRIPGFMPIEHLWTFRVYPDRELHIDLQRCDDHDRDKFYYDMEELKYHFVVGLTVTAALFQHKPDSALPGDCVCAFTVAKCKTGCGGIWAASVSVHGTLSMEHGFQGVRMHFSEGEYSHSDVIDDGRLLELASATDITATFEPVPRFPLSPLTQGQYTFQGFIYNRAEKIMRCVLMAIELQPNDLLSGRITDLSTGNTKALEGVWRCSQIAFAEMSSDGDGRDLVCAASAKRHSLEGRGEVKEWRNLCIGIQLEEQFAISLAIVEARRRWSPADHAHYPGNFLKAVRLCLLSSTCKTPPIYNLPGEMWLHVFGFCDVEWFE